MTTIEFWGAATTSIQLLSTGIFIALFCKYLPRVLNTIFDLWIKNKERNVKIVLKESPPVKSSTTLQNKAYKTRPGPK